MTGRAKERQLALFAEPDVLEVKFIAFHHDHPQVYERLRDLALDMRARGVRHGSIAMLYEVLRYELALDGVRDLNRGVVLNNSFRSRYARLLMANERTLAGWFDVRELKTDAKGVLAA